MVRQSMLKVLKRKGLKMTPQRLAIIEALAAMRDLHPSAGAVYREARKIRKGLSLSTTYATLNQLSRRASSRHLSSTRRRTGTRRTSVSTST